IKVTPAPTKTVITRQAPDGQKKVPGVSEDYLISKLPPDGREVPFVVPLFRPSYVQPSGSLYSAYQKGLQVWDLRNRKDFSSSALDLPHPQSHMQRYDSVSSVQSSTSSMRDSLGSSRSLESITLSGDERETGKLNIRLSYQEAREQVWITLVQCKDLNISTDCGEQQKVGIKGVITVPKPVQFKSSIKEGSSDVEFMETFVFALPLQQLRTAGLAFRLQTHVPRKRTLGECALSLRQLGPQETQHWLEVRPPSKAPVCHAELHLGTCFQAVSGRIQFQVLGAQNISTSSAPFSQSIFVKVEMHALGRLVTRKKTRVMRSSGGQVRWAETFLFPLAAHEQGLYFLVKLYSRSSVRRKHFLGQVHLGFESPSADAVEQWRDTITHPEKLVIWWQ
ncbi:tandem C2 domains nuclear protein-like, partial [Scleropages formosus]